MDDLISRQAAISAICNACGKIDCDKMDKCEKLQLPPANCSEFPNNSDTISREQVIATIDSFNVFESRYDQIKLELMIRELPPIQPAEPKRGTWIDTGCNEEWYAREYICSECGDTMLGEANFCPNCGAKMEGAE